MASGATQMPNKVIFQPRGHETVPEWIQYVDGEIKALSPDLLESVRRYCAQQNTQEIPAARGRWTSAGLVTTKRGHRRTWLVRNSREELRMGLFRYGFKKQIIVAQAKSGSSWEGGNMVIVAGGVGRNVFKIWRFQADESDIPDTDHAVECEYSDETPTEPSVVLTGPDFNLAPASSRSAMDLRAGRDGGVKSTASRSLPLSRPIDYSVGGVENTLSVRKSAATRFPADIPPGFKSRRAFEKSRRLSFDFSNANEYSKNRKRKEREIDHEAPSPKRKSRKLSAHQGSDGLSLIVSGAMAQQPPTQHLTSRFPPLLSTIEVAPNPQLYTAKDESNISSNPLVYNVKNVTVLFLGKTGAVVRQRPWPSCNSLSRLFLQAEAANIINEESKKLTAVVDGVEINLMRGLEEDFDELINMLQAAQATGLTVRRGTRDVI